MRSADATICRAQGFADEEEDLSGKDKHKVVEQRRRQKITEKVNELVRSSALFSKTRSRADISLQRELLNCQQSTHNMIGVLQSSVDNVKSMKDTIYRLFGTKPDSVRTRMLTSLVRRATAPYTTRVCERHA